MRRLVFRFYLIQAFYFSFTFFFICSFIVMRRVFLIMSILYCLRSMTMYVTVLPVSSTTYYCSPKSNSTSLVIIAKHAFQLMSGFGLSINGKHTYCGDFIYSGHTVMLVLGYLVISECKYNFFFISNAVGSNFKHNPD